MRELKVKTSLSSLTSAVLTREIKLNGEDHMQNVTKNSNMLFRVWNFFHRFLYLQAAVVVTILLLFLPSQDVK